jgi:predicted DNA-binding transcriptional regulator YafY
MPRNKGLIRQWTLLQRLATKRSNTIPALASDLKVNARTIRRDLNGLQSAGFPIYDEVVDGTVYWRVDAKHLLEALPRNMLTVPEICALYYSRALLQGIAGSDTLGDLQRALNKIEAALPPATKRFLDHLPSVIAAKPAFGKPLRAQSPEMISQLIEAATARRVVSMRYFSQENRREKDYIVHPYRIVIAQNAPYLEAYVPEYGELRRFLVSRIKKLTTREDGFSPVAELSTVPFSKSLGAHSGQPVKVHLRFLSSVAPYVTDRVWHETQQFKERRDGSVVMTLNVAEDHTLKQWILGFGCGVRVLGPRSLLDWVVEQLEDSRSQYGEGAAVDTDLQPPLPYSVAPLAAS